MRADAESQRVSAQALEKMASELSERDRAVVDMVGELRIMSALQIEAVHFPLSSHASRTTATRTCRRVLERLVRDGLLARLERRVGGLHAGSSGYCYGLSPLGHRLVDGHGVRRRLHEPNPAHVDHTLAIGQVLVDLIVTSQAGEFELIDYQAEPGCWREFATVRGIERLRPDLYVAVGVGEWEHRFFTEVDRGFEGTRFVLDKCRIYESYRESGIEQSKEGVFPRVAWIVPDEMRAQRLRESIDKCSDLPARLFIVATASEAVAVLSAEVQGGGSP